MLFCRAEAEPRSPVGGEVTAQALKLDSAIQNLVLIFNNRVTKATISQGCCEESHGLGESTAFNATILDCFLCALPPTQTFLGGLRSIRALWLDVGQNQQRTAGNSTGAEYFTII